MCNRNTFPQLIFSPLLLFVHLPDLSNSLLSLFVLLHADCLLTLTLFSFAFEGYWRPLFVQDSSIPFHCFAVAFVCLCTVWDWEEGNNTRMHSAVCYLLSPLLTAAHKKFTESPSPSAFISISLWAPIMQMKSQLYKPYVNGKTQACPDEITAINLINSALIIRTVSEAFGLCTVWRVPPTFIREMCQTRRVKLPEFEGWLSRNLFTASIRARCLSKHLKALLKYSHGR